MAEPLNASHFKLRQRVPLSGTPEVARLATVLAESCARGLSAHAPCPWRVSSEGVEEGEGSEGEDARRNWRFESALGSLAVQISLDRPAACAVFEAAMGGTGTEAPFDIGERPYSKIENAVLELVIASLAEQVAAALQAELDRPFSHFASAIVPDAPRKAIFRFVVNVFGHSGEIGISMPAEELMAQLKAGTEQTAEAGHDGIQEQVGRSAVEFMVTLGHETFTLQDIASLRPGMMLNLRSTAAAPVQLWSSGVPTYEAQLGRAGSRLAVTIKAAAAR